MPNDVSHINIYCAILIIFITMFEQISAAHVCIKPFIPAGGTSLGYLLSIVHVYIIFEQHI